MSEPNENMVCAYSVYELVRTVCAFFITVAVATQPYLSKTMLYIFNGSSFIIYESIGICLST